MGIGPGVQGCLPPPPVVARELGLPTIVGVSGGLMKRLKTGMRVHVDAGKGKLTIIRQEEREEDKGQFDPV